MQPLSYPEAFASPADRAQCRRLLRGGSRSFHAASLMLPARVREAATGLYAFCRMADDAIDQGGDQRRALEDLHRRLERIYAGDPSAEAPDRAFADCVARHGIPQSLPAGLLEGFSWDASLRRYETESDVTDYAVRVAGTVGVMMALVMGVRDERALSAACDLGVAMQFTNIARDVGEDARAGRLYLPLAWLREVGIDPESWLAAPSFSDALGSVIERLLCAAEALYRSGEAGLAHLPAGCRPSMFAARLLYAEIGHELARRRFDSVGRRAIVGGARKLRLMADAWRAAHAPELAPWREPLAEAAFLLGPLRAARLDADIGAAEPAAQSARGRTRWPRIDGRIAWLVELFERLERRDGKGAPWEPA